MASGIQSFSMRAPDDVQEIGQVLRRLAGAAPRRIAIIGKVEGTATANDFSRSLALRAITDELRAAGMDPARAQIILSTGCEGVISPGGYVFASFGDGTQGLRVGVGRSAEIAPADLLDQPHLDAARSAVGAALADCGLTPDDSLLVFMKSPLLMHREAANLPEAQARWANVSAAARGVAALGLGAALREIDPKDAVIGNLLVRDDLFCQRGMVFSGTETRACEAIVIGHSAGAAGPRLRSGPVANLVDIAGMAAIVSGDPLGGVDAALASRGRIAAAFFKAGVRRDGDLFGRRTTVFSSDLDPDKHMRAAASGVLAALMQDCRMFVSGGCEHQAPDGGGLFAVISDN